MRFELATAGRVVFGLGSVAEATAAAAWGRRALLVTGRVMSRAAGVKEALEGQGCAVVSLAVAGEPTVAAVREATRLTLEAGAEVVVAVGGGSVLDTGKAVAALAANGGDPLDYLEVIGSGQPLTLPALPLVAVPTTAGTGSEVTRNAVLLDPERRVKASLRSPLMLPRLAVVDPDLCRGLPPAITAATGLDALTQLVEPYLSVRANPATDGFCREGMRRAARSLRRACTPPEDAAVREDLALASLLGGLALAYAGLGAVHGLAAVLGGDFAAPHGALCARLLAPVLAANLTALRARTPGAAALERLAEVAALLTGCPEAGPEDGVAWVEELVEDLHIPRLAGYGVGSGDIARVVAGAGRASSMRGNPVALTAAELSAVVEQAL